MIAASLSDELTVPARARELAARLSALFERDVEIVGRLNVAQSRLRDANERLWSGLAPDAFGRVHDGVASAGRSQIVGVMRDAVGGGREAEAVVLGALQDVHWTIHHAFLEFQWVSEERRVLAVGVGELSWQLTEVVMSAGWSADDARNANVHELSGAGIG
jgi:hypothetical protein